MQTVTIVAHDVGTVGGMERQLGRVVEGLLDRGLAVSVVARRCEVAPHPHLRFVRVRAPRRPFSIAYPWFAVLGSIAVARARNGLLHTTGAVVANTADVSTVHFLHGAFQEPGADDRSSRSGLLYALNQRVSSWMSVVAERYCYRPAKTRHLVAVSHGLARDIRRHHRAMEDSVTVIPNGVDRVRFRPDPGARQEARSGLGWMHVPVAVFVGGDWERKGLRFAIGAVARAEPWRLVVVGEGDRARYERLAAQEGAADRVRFVGAQPDPSPFYAAGDVFLLPTAYEAFPLVLLEAAASGLPILVTRVNGAEDMLIEGQSGWFVERDAESIAGRLRELAADDAGRRAMGEAARAATEPYGWDRTADAHAALYEALAAGRQLD